MKILIQIPIIFFILYLCPHAMAIEPVAVDDALSSTYIGTHIEYLVDKQKNLRIGDLAKPSAKTDLKWQRSTKDKLSFGFSRDVYWVRFSIENKKKHPVDVFISEEYVSLSHCDLYKPLGKGEYEVIKTGASLPFTMRPVEFRTFVFPVTLKAGQTETYYMRFQPALIMDISLSIWSVKAFNKMRDMEAIFFWMFYGILLVMCVYNLFIFFSTRDVSYILYILSIAAYGFVFLALKGLGFQYLWPEQVGWNRFSIPVFMAITNAATPLFAIYFIQIKKHSKPWFVIHVVTVVGALLILALMPIMQNIRIAIYSAALWSLASTPFGIIMSIHLGLVKKVRQATIYMISFMVLLSGHIFTFLKYAGVLPANVITENGLMIGLAMQIVLLSFGLADRINVMRRELAELNSNLELKVEERTEELTEANEELKSMNDRLTEARNALWGEMELAKKIQTVLLPDNPAINGYEITAFMKTAAMVGGDYYDVINVEGMDWIVIGDVSGHGVPAGLIMMMVQTSIRTAVTQNPNLNPSDLLKLINKAVSENIKKMGEDKYMTITVMATHQNGRFAFSGLHQDIMIYRAAGNDVELVQTNGMWIGLISDIANMNRDDTIIIERGDTMLMYTDGITEARLNMIPSDRDTDGLNMFGDERLRDVLLRLGSKSPEEVRDGILQELEEYDCRDDVTMLIMKRS